MGEFGGAFSACEEKFPIYSGAARRSFSPCHIFSHFALFIFPENRNFGLPIRSKKTFPVYESL